MQIPMTQCASVAVWPVLLLFSLYCLVFALPYSDWCRCFSGCTYSTLLAYYHHHQHSISYSIHYQTTTTYPTLPTTSRPVNKCRHTIFFIIIIPLWLFIGTEGRTRLHQIQPLPSVGQSGKIHTSRDNNNNDSSSIK